MNSLDKIKQAMIKKGIPAEKIETIQFPEKEASAITAKDVVGVVRQMDALLTNEECLAVMEEQGCCKTGKPHKAHKDFGRQYADKTLEEKIALLPTLDTPHKAPCRLHADGTLSVYWEYPSPNGNLCVCGCSMIRELKQEPASSISPTFCACCAGHTRHHLQNSLGVKLRLKEVVSSALCSGGTGRCEFLFEIV